MKQISVFLENKPGSLNEMAAVLADNSINMRPLSLAEADGFGIVRMIVDDMYKATTVLKEAGFVHNLVPVVAAEIPDEPGGLLKVLDIFNSEGVNIDYMYAFSESNSKEANFVFKVADEKKAEAILKSKGIQVI